MEIVILIPPSEGKAKGGKKNPLININMITKCLIKEISKANTQKLYGLKEKALAEAIDANKNILKSKTLPAIERYTGVVYDAVDYDSLENKELFNKRIRIVSGLFGLVKPTDLIPNYRLKIDKLKADKLWLEENSKKLEGKFVIDLLPKAHKKAVRYEEGIEVEFVKFKNGKKTPAGHQGKFVKGLFVRWLISNNITEISEFKSFKQESYSWNGEYFLRED